MTASQLNYMTFKAVTDVNARRFVKLSTADAGGVIQADNGLDLTVGISGPFDYGPPGASGSTALLHAPAGKPCQVILSGVALVELGVGGTTIGARLASDATGRGVIANNNVGNTFGALALEAGVVGDIVRVLVAQISARTTA